MDRDVRREISDEVTVVLQEAGKDVPEFGDTTSLLQGGLHMDSLDFAVLVVRLERKFHCDPFNNARLERFPTTFGEMVALYQTALDSRR